MASPGLQSTSMITVWSNATPMICSIQARCGSIDPRISSTEEVRRIWSLVGMFIFERKTSLMDTKEKSTALSGELAKGPGGTGILQDCTREDRRHGEEISAKRVKTP